MGKFSYQHKTLEILKEAPNYNKWLISKFQAFLGKNILEIGSGTGNFTREISGLGFDITPTEIDRKFVEILKKDFPQAFYLDITNPKDKKRFDSVIAINVLEHIENDKLALSNIYKILKKGGSLILLVPAHQFLYGSYDKSFGHFRRYSQKELTKKITACNFKIKKLIDVNKAGALGWFLNAKILKLKEFPKSQVFFVNKITPLLDLLDKIIPFNFGQSIICICKK